MDYEKEYKEALQRAKNLHKDAIDMGKNLLAKQCEIIFPELKKESENEKIIYAIKEAVNEYWSDDTQAKTDIIAWLEKQGDTNETINRDEFAQGVLRGAAINLITWIDYNAAEDNMCLSNMECKDIEDALVSGNWNKIYTYIKKKLKKQGEQKAINDTDEEIVNAVKDTSVLDLVEPKFKVGNGIYEWDDEKKVLKKTRNALEECEIENIEHGKYYYCIKDYFCGGKKQASKGDVVQALRGMSIMALGVKANEYFLQVNSIKQKPAWSKDDENVLKAITYTVKNSGYNHCIGVSIEVMIDWLKSLKDRMKRE